MAKTTYANENWIGTTFANSWEVLKEIGYKEGAELGFGTNNKHYLCKNHICGVETYMERTSMRRYINDTSKTCLHLCKGCINGSKKGNCHYSTPIRHKTITKEIDRTPKIEIGKEYGNFIVIAIQPSGNFADHQCRALVKCKWCGAKQSSRYDHLLECSVACDCFKSHSSGEKIVKEWLNKHSINFESEYTFKDLNGLGGKPLRYDFAIFSPTLRLIEVDGSQHFEEAGSYYNPTGTVKVHDALKNEFAFKHNIPLLRITYDQLLNLDNIIPQFLNTSPLA